MATFLSFCQSNAAEIAQLPISVPLPIPHGVRRNDSLGVFGGEAPGLPRSPSSSSLPPRPDSASARVLSGVARAPLATQPSPQSPFPYLPQPTAFPPTIHPLSPPRTPAGSVVPAAPPVHAAVLPPLALAPDGQALLHTSLSADLSALAMASGATDVFDDFPLDDIS